jgi:hypothetical protein
MTPAPAACAPEGDTGRLALAGAPVHALKQPVLPRLRARAPLYDASWAVPLAQQTWRNVAPNERRRKPLLARYFVML